ncbi:MAG: hypothetical protein M1814_001904 [Vezdaea aestivalis]|nr:MAG: hypothetical protein M1814_001904 [Vezdaea aestivalis]
MGSPVATSHTPRRASPGPSGPIGREASIYGEGGESGTNLLDGTSNVETDRVSIIAAADLDARLSSVERLTYTHSSLTDTRVSDVQRLDGNLQKPIKLETKGVHGSTNESQTPRSAHQITPARLRRNSSFLEKRLVQQEEFAAISLNEAASFRNNTLQLEAAPARASKRIEFFKQPKTRSITQEQLVAEIKGIYAGLVLIEQKCIEVDAKQAKKLEEARKAIDIDLDPEQYKALIALHKTLLNEHHDFFLASQHPSANSALKRLATKYSMPARMWRHAIHSFLELLRHRLPDSKDHMLAFIYIAYSMMALLFETVKAFEDTWIECLGDLARYRMAIEDDDVRDREVWMEVASFWYTKAADRSPSTGRLYHHLAILARPNLQKQLFYYTKSLTVSAPFYSTRESILTLLKPVMERDHTSLRVLKSDHYFVRVHARLFLNKDLDLASHDADSFLSDLMNSIGRAVQGWKQTGAFQAASNVASLFGYGSDDSVLQQCIAKNEQSTAWDDAQPRVVSPLLKLSIRMTFDSLKTCLQLTGNYDVQPYIHVILVLLLHLQDFPSATNLLDNDIPWTELTDMLNVLIRMDSSDHRMNLVRTATFPRSKDAPRPLTEDFLLRQTFYAKNYFPKEWFDKALSDDDDSRTLELTSMQIDRSNRILSLAIRISAFHNPLEFSTQTQSFSCRRGEFDHTHDLSAHPSKEKLAIVVSHDILDSWSSQLDAYISCRLCEISVPYSIALGSRAKFDTKFEDAIRNGRMKLINKHGHNDSDDQELFDTDQDFVEYTLAVARHVQESFLNNKKRHFMESGGISDLLILTEDKAMMKRALASGLPTITINGQKAYPRPHVAQNAQLAPTQSPSKTIRSSMSMDIDSPLYLSTP